MLKRVFSSRTGMTFAALGNGVFLGYYLGARSVAAEPWLLELRRIRLNARWRSYGG